MNSTKLLNDEQVIKKGVNALHKAIGPAATRRFINMARSDRVDSIVRHRKWQKGLDKNEFFDSVFGKK